MGAASGGEGESQAREEEIGRSTHCAVSHWHVAMCCGPLQVPFSPEEGRSSCAEANIYGGRPRTDEGLHGGGRKTEAKLHRGGTSAEEKLHGRSPTTEEEIRGGSAPTKEEVCGRCRCTRPGSFASSRAGQASISVSVSVSSSETTGEPPQRKRSSVPPADNVRACW